MRETARSSATSTTPELATHRATIVATIGAASDRGAEAAGDGRRADRSASQRAARHDRRLRRAGGRPPRARWSTTARWFVQRNGARAARADRARPRRVPLLQPLLRKGDPRVARAAVVGARRHPRSVGGARHPHRPARGDRRAARARSSTRWSPTRLRASCRCWRASSPRASRSARTTRSCSRRSTALGAVGSDDAVPPLVDRDAGAESFWRRRKARALKERGVDALVRIGGARATPALDDAAQTGDRQLKTLAQAARG